MRLASYPVHRGALRALCTELKHLNNATRYHIILCFVFFAFNKTFCIFSSLTVASASQDICGSPEALGGNCVSPWQSCGCLNAHLGNASRERRSHFAVYFTAGFSNKTVPCTMNELYLTGATREAEWAHYTMRKYSRKHVTQNLS